MSSYYDSINGDKDQIPDQVWEEIFEGLYAYISSGEKSCHPHNNITIWELHKYDPINYGACGTYSIDGEPAFDFEIRDGNRGGSEVINIAPPDYLEKPKRYYTRYYFAPDGLKVPAERMKAAWFILNNNSTMQENQRKMAYDLTMCPATKTRQYWKDYAASISAVICSESIEIPD